MTIFNSYVKLPEGIYTTYLGVDEPPSITAMNSCEDPGIKLGSFDNLTQTEFCVSVNSGKRP